MLVLLVSECKQEETKINYMMICKERMGGGVLPLGREEERWSEETRTSGEKKAKIDETLEAKNRFRE